jgi:hypothetical protein
LHLSRDNGVTFTIIDAAQVQDKPNLHEHAIDSSNFNQASAESDVGQTFILRVEAVNVAGSLLSSTTSAVLAGEPAAPSLGPGYDSSQTNQDQIAWTLPLIDPTDATKTGGSVILSFSLEADDGQGGNFSALYGMDEDSLSTSYLLK